MRELENLIERAVILSRGTELHIPLAELETPANANCNTTSAHDSARAHGRVTDEECLETVEREHIVRVPYGAVGALAALWMMGAPFGFMGFLGVVSLVGVIVSHIIVLFDFIEEKHAEGEPFEQAVLDAGIMRLRPVMITVGATVIALFPLAAHGGPLWEPMCYAQIGGLTAATFITLLLVPVIYAICVLDLKIVKWERRDVAEKIDGTELRTQGATV